MLPVTQIRKSKGRIQLYYPDDDQESDKVKSPKAKTGVSKKISGNNAGQSRAPCPILTWCTGSRSFHCTDFSPGRSLLEH
jgi:hypothetical protein